MLDKVNIVLQIDLWKNVLLSLTLSKNVIIRRCDT